MTLNQLLYVCEIAKAGSLNEAAKNLFISQPSLTSALKSLEQELGFDIFTRSKTGVTLTIKGSEFIGYAKSVLEQMEILDAKYISKTNVKRSFSVSMQHYTFAVNAFVEVINKFGMENYEFEVRETKTYDVINNVKNQISEIGVLYLNDFNRQVLTKIFAEEGLEFTPLFECDVYVYMSKSHPLAKKSLIDIEELNDYPCLGFNQGEHNSAYFAEEVLSTYQYKRFIRVNDRATILNLMIGLNGFTLCSGIICEDLNGTDYCAVKLNTSEKMEIGYLSRKNSIISQIGKLYIEEISKYSDRVLK